MARETNNIVERVHGTLKDRLKPMRGLKSKDSTKDLLEGYVIHYNYVRKHQSLKGKTPAQKAGITTPNNWKSLIEQATKYDVGQMGKIKPIEEAKLEKIAVVAV